MTKYFFELSIICPSGIWENQDGFERDFEKFLESKGLQGNKINSRNKIVVEIIGNTDLVKDIKTEVKQEKELPQPKPVKMKNLIDTLTHRLDPEPKKHLRVFKDSIL